MKRRVGLFKDRAYVLRVLNMKERSLVDNHIVKVFLLIGNSIGHKTYIYVKTLKEPIAVLRYLYYGYLKCLPFW